MITLFDVNLPKEGFNHKSLLLIIFTIKGNYVQMVLLNNNSRLNVCPFKVVSCLGLGLINFTPSN